MLVLLLTEKPGTGVVSFSVSDVNKGTKTESFGTTHSVELRIYVLCVSIIHHAENVSSVGKSHLFSFSHFDLFRGLEWTNMVHR